MALRVLCVTFCLDMPLHLQVQSVMCGATGCYMLKFFI